MTACIPPVDLHLIFEEMGFDKLPFSSYLNLNFAGYKDSKNQFRNKPKMKFVEIHFSKSKCRSTRDCLDSRYILATHFINILLCVYGVNV